MTWRGSLGGNLRVSGGVTNTPVEQSKSHTIDKHSQGPSFCSWNRLFHSFPYLLKFESQGKFCTNLPLGGGGWAVCKFLFFLPFYFFNQGMFLIVFPNCTCGRAIASFYLVKGGNVMQVPSRQKKEKKPSPVQRSRIRRWQVPSQTQWWRWRSVRIRNSVFRCKTGYRRVYRKFPPHFPCI